MLSDLMSPVFVRRNQVRSAHDYLGDFLEEVQIYTQAGKLVSYLRAWECGKETLFDCAIKLTHDMAIAGYYIPAICILSMTMYPQTVSRKY
jgi:hypothetical protein